MVLVFSSIPSQHTSKQLAVEIFHHYKEQDKMAAEVVLKLFILHTLSLRPEIVLCSFQYKTTDKKVTVAREMLAKKTSFAQPSNRFLKTKVDSSAANHHVGWQI